MIRILFLLIYASLFNDVDIYTYLCLCFRLGSHHWCRNISGEDRLFVKDIPCSGSISNIPRTRDLHLAEGWISVHVLFRQEVLPGYSYKWLFTHCKFPDFYDSCSRWKLLSHCSQVTCLSDWFCLVKTTFVSKKKTVWTDADYNIDFQNDRQWFQFQLEQLFLKCQNGIAQAEVKEWGVTYRRIV